MLNTKSIEEKKLSVDEILNAYFAGCKKDTSDCKIGIEYERLPVSALNCRAVSYLGENGIYELLRNFAKFDGWTYLTDDYNIIGLQKGEDRITLEPGSQFELSLAPENNISALKTKIDNFNKRITPMLRKFNINLLEYGVSPVTTYKNIVIIPKKRYHIMADYLWGILSDVMMRETAGIQACMDFVSEEDAMDKFRIANMLSPFMTAMFANSPIRGGVDTGYKTFRGLSWLNTDAERCGFINKKLFNSNSDYSFKAYVDDIIDTPMIFIKREDKTIEICGKITFRQYMESGYESYTATMEDFRLHANLCFPDVRLRNFIEIRNHDCVNHGLQYAVLAAYKGILYSKNSRDEINKLFSKFTYNDFAEFRYNVPRVALKTKIKRHHAKDIAKEILSIAQSGLREFGDGEETYLEPIMELAPYGISPADIILKHWNSDWKKDVSKMVKFISN